MSKGLWYFIEILRVIHLKATWYPHLLSYIATAEISNIVKILIDNRMEGRKNKQIITINKTERVNRSG